VSDHPSGEHHDLIEEAALPRLGLGPVNLVAIFVGGALGTVSRYLTGLAFPTTSGHFPFTTLVVNVSGSLLIGLLIPLTDHLSTRVPYFRPFLAIGILGGWTTYSTLAVDAVELAHHGHVAAMLLSLLATVVGGSVAVVLGNAAGHRVLPP
jgi:CrcB protein